MVVDLMHLMICVLSPVAVGEEGDFPLNILWRSALDVCLQPENIEDFRRNLLVIVPHQCGW